MKYRADIDGLRSIAILPVVFFHTGISIFSGGYVGVDVFFVISGFLITSILAEEIRRGEFSIVKFYDRRIRRIFPALFFIILLSSIAALSMFMPKELSNFGQSVFTTAGFSSNFLFWRETGYFDGAADTKPLLHTWSLAIEEQFYIVFPIFLFVTHKYFSGRWLSFILVFALASFALSVWGVTNAPQSAFYLAHYRAWELLLGSLLGIGALPSIPRQHIRDILSVIGLSLILGSVFMYTGETPFPGLAALAPCLGTLLIIYAGVDGPSLAGRFLSLRPLVFIGLISYSLYLWHWPVIVFIKTYLMRELSGPEMGMAILISFAGAFLSYKYIEAPFRNRGTLTGWKQLFGTAAGVMGFSAAFGLLAHLTDGLPERLSQDAVLFARGVDDFQTDAKCDNSNQEQVSSGDLCHLGADATSPQDFVLWGDSHARSLMPMLNDLSAEYGKSGLFATSSGCPPLLGGHIMLLTGKSSCKSFNDAMYEFIKDGKFKNVILVGRWSVYTIGWGPGDGEYKKNKSPLLIESPTKIATTETSLAAFRSSMRRTVEHLTALGVRVWVVQEPPQVAYDTPIALGRFTHFGWPWQDLAPTLEGHRNRQVKIQEALDDIARTQFFERIDLAPILCPHATCEIAHQGRSLYKDDDHLSKTGAAYVRDVFKPIFDQK